MRAKPENGGRRGAAMAMAAEPAPGRLRAACASWLALVPSLCRCAMRRVTASPRLGREKVRQPAPGCLLPQGPPPGRAGPCACAAWHPVHPPRLVPRKRTTCVSAPCRVRILHPAMPHPASCRTCVACLAAAHVDAGCGLLLGVQGGSAERWQWVVLVLCAAALIFVAPRHKDDAARQRQRHSTGAAEPAVPAEGVLGWPGAARCAREGAVGLCFALGLSLPP